MKRAVCTFCSLLLMMLLVLITAHLMFGSTAQAAYPVLSQKSYTPDSATVNCGQTITGTWVIKDPFPYLATDASLASDGTYAYAFGGGRTTEVFSETNRYDPVADTWVALTPYPTGYTGAPAVYGGNGKVYVIGGNISGGADYTTTLRIYDIATDSWTTGAPVPEPRAAAAAAYDGGKIYLAGGYKGVLETGNVYVYDIAGDSWEQLASLPQGVWDAGFGIINGKMYVAGGWAINANISDLLYTYNIQSNTWITSTHLQQGVRGPGSAVVNGELWVFGGEGYPNAQPIARTQIYNPSINSWRDGPPLNVTRAYLYGASVGPYVVAPGGFSSQSPTTYTTTNEVLYNVPLVCTPTPLPTSTATATTTSTGTVAATATGTATVTACPIQFQDVPPSSEVSSFYPYVRCLACRGVLGGYACGNTNPQTGQAEPCGTSGNPYFRPGNNITRGQIAKIVSNAAGYDNDVEGQTFADVPPSDDPSSFYVYIERLTAHNVMGGYPCGSTEDERCDDQNRPYFRAHWYSTRAQLAKIVSNAAGFVENVVGQTFADVLPPEEENDPSSFYLYIERLAQRGVIGGYPCGSSSPGPDLPCDSERRPYFRPSLPVTRAQAAKIVANAFFPNCVTPARK
jgi:N-acetylneuraminic acid mutarotase